jgi:pimeloyl-ACP methyl ester carboxylesterase
MRPFAFALMMLLTAFAAASAQPATPDSENGRYSFNLVADGVLRLDTRTGQVSQCGKSDDAGWTWPSVVMLHGFGDTGDMWAPAAAVLVRDHTVVVPDLRGMGHDCILKS